MGKSLLSKELFEVLDDKNLSVTYKVIGGSILEVYKTFKFIVQMIPKVEGCFVIWTLEYERLSVDVPDPKPMMQFALDLTRDIEANLV
ncbi:Kirola [Morella rubra]|uniref:Kirola n=1 Tax=Morella rubra TaxID=262757 RepID=A0A6A1UQ28_9ROSI|nr:Kirola [Morella rubra]